MLVHDLPAETVRIPDGDRHSAVYFSGNSLRHRRLGYLIQERYPGLLKAWWIYAPQQSQRLQAKLTKAWRLVANSQTGAAAVEMIREGDVGGLMAMTQRRLARGDLRRFGRLARMYTQRSNYGEIEQEMFGEELARLEAKASLHPESIDSPNKKAQVAALAAIDPFLIVTFGGPLLGGRVLSKARGFAINQHAGWSPSLKGASTTETAIYHREIGWVGNTVHLMDTHADSGAVLRRSTATLHPDDDLAHCFFGVCATGSKMMLETIGSVLHDDELACFPQPKGGQTVLNIDFSAAKREAIARDMANGWLADALQMVREF
jgi:folate-dependent phosphoribosylglycinamide formyltransferase PurN